MNVRELGSSMLFKAEHASKALRSRDFRELESVTLSRESQFIKAYVLIVVTESGITTSVISSDLNA